MLWLGYTCPVWNQKICLVLTACTAHIQSRPKMISCAWSLLHNLLKALHAFTAVTLLICLMMPQWCAILEHHPTTYSKLSTPSLLLFFYSTDMHHDATVMCSPLTITPQPAQSSPHRNCFYSDLRHDATVMCSPWTSLHNQLKALHILHILVHHVRPCIHFGCLKQIHVAC